jgi:hypothetical protein
MINNMNSNSSVTIAPLESTQVTQTHSIYLDAEKYLPVNFQLTDRPWSISLNILCSFRMSDYLDGKFALLLEYQDLRGKHRLPVDTLELSFENALLFSNLVEIPVRGELSDICLKLTGVPKDIDVETELLHIHLEESRSYSDSQPIRKVL